MEHTKRLLRAFFELSQTHRGEFAVRFTWLHSLEVWSGYCETIIPTFWKDQRYFHGSSFSIVLIAVSFKHNEHCVCCFCWLKGRICHSSIWGCFFCHRRTRTAGRSERGVCEVCRRSPQHWEIRHPAAEDHQACECTLPHRRLCPACWRLLTVTLLRITGLSLLFVQMLHDLNTYLHKAIPDTKLTIRKYLDVKFEYLVSWRYFVPVLFWQRSPLVLSYVFGFALTQYKILFVFCLSVVLPKGERNGWWRVQQHREWLFL